MVFPEHHFWRQEGVEEEDSPESTCLCPQELALYWGCISQCWSSFLVVDSPCFVLYWLFLFEINQKHNAAEGFSHIKLQLVIYIYICNRLEASWVKTLHFTQLVSPKSSTKILIHTGYLKYTSFFEVYFYVNYLGLSSCMFVNVCSACGSQKNTSRTLRLDMRQKPACRCWKLDLLSGREVSTLNLPRYLSIPWCTLLEWMKEC